MLTDTALIGIEIGGGRRPYTYAALDGDLNLLTITSASSDDLLAYINNIPSATVAVGSPSQLPRAGKRKRLAKDALLTDTIGRFAERELRGRDILVPLTSPRLDECSAQVRNGLLLYKRLEKLGARPYPQDGASFLWLETNAHACFCTLLGQTPMSRRSLEGRLQRQIALYDAGLQIPEPMDFFEELTRHRLLMGQLPMEHVQMPEELDAMAAAYMAWMAAKRPSEVMRLGSELDGWLALPVRELKEKY
jgi:hypothetical protein